MPKHKHEDETLLKSEQPFRKLIPSLITIAGLCFGLSAIRFAMIERWELCIGFIGVAAIIDGLDGRAARMLRATSTFGAQLDSLSDFICFGVAPVVILYMWQLENVKSFGWAVVLFYVVCAALRLARFNTAIVDNKQQPWEKNFFTGVPSPAGGLLVLAPLLLSIEPDIQVQLPNWLVCVYVMAVALLMVSRIPTFAMKNIRVPAKHIILVMMASVFVLVIAMIEPWKMLLMVGMMYLGSIPFSYQLYRKLYRQQVSE